MPASESNASNASKTKTITSVVNIKKINLKARGIADALAWSTRENSLYIGRAMRYVPGATNTSFWANPYSVERYGRDQCLALYEKYVRADLELWSKLDELEGKELGCWCCPEPCHGNVLIRLLLEKKEKEQLIVI